MSPRKDRYRVPEWRVKLFKDESKKILFGPYICPKCNQDNLKIKVDKEKKEVTVTCDCGLEHSLKYIPSYDPVDYYNKFIDECHHSSD